MYLIEKIHKRVVQVRYESTATNWLENEIEGTLTIYSPMDVKFLNELGITYTSLDVGYDIWSFYKENSLGLFRGIDQNLKGKLELLTAWEVYIYATSGECSTPEKKMIASQVLSGEYLQLPLYTLINTCRFNVSILFSLTGVFDRKIHESEGANST